MLQMICHRLGNGKDHCDVSCYAAKNVSKKDSAPGKGENPRFPIRDLGQEPFDQLAEVVLLRSAKDQGSTKII
ncbi:hypothetical protein AAC387_Pa01g3311 [Persea americana]